MIIEAVDLEGAFYLEPDIYPDERGYFYEWFQKERFQKETGIDFDIVQFNCSKSSKGVLRGLHYQLNPFAQAKLIAVSQGEIQDVIVDIRKESPTFGKYFSVILNAEKKNQVYVPRGFAHGFLVLSETAEITYAIDSKYSPEHDCGILYNDTTIAVKWKNDAPLVSKKDVNLKSFLQAENNF